MNGIDCIMLFEFPAQPSLAAVACGDGLKSHSLVADRVVANEKIRTDAQSNKKDYNIQCNN